jgi:integrase/recombinase XerC
MQNMHADTISSTTTIAKTLSVVQAITAFVAELTAKNRAAGTIATYRGDLTEFATWLTTTNLAATRVDQIQRVDITEYLAELGHRGVKGVTRAKKLAAIRELFRFLVTQGSLTVSPAASIETPKKEKSARAWLIPEEYRAMLAAAGGIPRDYAILQVFLQTGIRVSELCALRLDDVDLTSKVLHVRYGKGSQARAIELERKGLLALKGWLTARGQLLRDLAGRGKQPHPSEHLFLNQYGEPISERGVQKLITKYVRAAGITKKAGCHSLRHTFATRKAQMEVSPYDLKELLGHAKLDTTMIYVHMARADRHKLMEATSL